MIISDKLIKADGTTEIVNIEVPDDYFNTQEVDPKAELIAQIESATTIAALRTAMLEYINAT